MSHMLLSHILPHLFVLSQVADERKGDLQTIAKLREDLEVTKEALKR